MEKIILRPPLWIIAMMVMVALSCGRDDGDVLFELQFPPPPIEFTIPPGLGTFDTHVFVQSPIPTYYESRLEDSGFSDDMVDLIQAKEGYLSSLFEDENLDFIHRVSIIIFDPFNPANKVEFFYLDPVPFRNKTGIELFPGITNISDWVKSGFIGIEIRLDFREISPTLIEMKLEFDLRAINE